MRYSAPRRRTVVLGIVLAGIAFFVVRLAFPAAPPREHSLYLVDARADRTTPLDLSQIHTRDESERTAPRVVVHTIAPSRLINTEAELEFVFDVLEDSTPRPLVFYRLPPPYALSKKALRAAIEDCHKGASRIALLRSLVPVRGPERSGGEEGCQSLDDDFIYMRDNFGGMGLFVDEATLALLKDCEPRG